ncbi:MAG TPA: ThuA domain-containing protein [Solirubrobacter sp.]|nr:ThuA domain-containing protein [Solirubrobacter sp.]
MSTYRYISLLAFIVAALVLPASAGAAPGSFIAQDHEVFGFIWSDTSSTNPQDNSVTINPGETVTFSYPAGTSVHNVAFNATGPQPASCQQTAPTQSGPGNPPLPAFPSPPGWAGTCTFGVVGTYVFYCVAHQSMTGTVVVEPANQNPTVTASRTPTGDVATGTPVSFSATGNDPDGDPLTYAWDFGDGGTATGANASHTYNSTGTYTAKVTVSDGRGGTGEATLTVIVTQGNRAPSVTASRTPTGNVVAGTAVSFSATGTDPDGDPLTYSWNFGDSGTSTAQNPSHTYTSAGTFNAVVTVSDGRGGTGSATVPVTVIADGENQNPTVTASRTPTGNVRVGIPISFSANGTDPNGDSLTYSWNFGDGETSTEQNPTHTFLFAANFSVVVTVSDGRGGTASATLGVNIQANRAPTIQTATATPIDGIAPLDVQFAATATDPDGHPITYEWDLDGNGTFETAGQTGARTYNSVTNAVLRVRDPFGGVTTRTLTINALAPVLPPAKFNVLVFSKTAAFRHSNIDEGITAIRQLGSEQGFNVDAIEDSSLFTDAFLSRYDAVVWLSTTGDVLNDAQQAAFERYIQAGGGYVGVHSAADTEYTWPWYGQLVGGYFRNHPNGTPTATVVVEDPTRPSTSHLPTRWTRVDEWYNFQGIVNPVINGGGVDVSPRGLTPIHVLLTMDESSYAEADGTDGVDDDHPIAWCKRFDGGRMFYTGLAHTEASWVEPNFLQHFLGGLEVAAGYTPDIACGEISPTGTSEVGATVPFVLGLSIAGPATLGAITPGVTAEYTTSVAATVTSTAGEATLTVVDPAAESPGRLMNGTYVLESPLQVRATNAANPNSAFGPVAGTPLTLLNYPRAISSDQVTLGFKQSVSASETLRAGSYRKALTFSLSTTTP